MGVHTAGRETHAAFDKGGVVTLVSDWTRGDPAITRFLASRGRNSIPYYLFVTLSGEIRELPQILTSEMLVQQAAESSQALIVSRFPAILHDPDGQKNAARPRPRGSIVRCSTG